MQKNRLLWLTENYPPQRGGMAQSCDRIIDGLRKRGFVIDIVHFINRGLPYQRVQQLNGTYMSVPIDESESHTLNCTWNFIKVQQPDAIVCFGGYLPVLAAPVFAAWLNIPLITMIRGNDFDSAIFTPRKRDILRDAIAASWKVTVVSHDKKEKIVRLYPMTEALYIPNGIDCLTWMPSASEGGFATTWKTEHCSGRICVGLFGELKAKKGVKFFIESMLQTEIVSRIHFLLIGTLTDDLSELLSGNACSFSHYSFLDRYELIKYFLCCDALAIPSLYDGMPNVLLEAGALAVPVIASRVDGMKDVIRNSENGLLFEPGDAASCRKAVFDFLERTPAQRKTLGENLKTTIHNTYSVNHEINGYEKIFSGLSSAQHSALRVQPK